MNAPNIYNVATKCSSAAFNILVQIFRKLAPVAFIDNQEQMILSHTPALAALYFNTPLQEHNCAPNLTFTEEGFFNHPHCDTEDISEFSFDLFIPISKETGKLVDLTKDYGFPGGKFLFPDFKCRIYFPKHEGIVKMVWHAKEYFHCTLS